MWTIRTEAREKGNADMLILPPLAVSIIGALPRFVGNDYLFAGRGSGPINGISKLKRLLDEASGVKGWVLHDLRRTARTLLARAKVDRAIAERILGHRIGGAAEQTYDRHDYSIEKRDALAALAELIGSIIKGVAPSIAELPERQ